MVLAIFYRNRKRVQSFCRLLQTQYDINTVLNWFIKSILLFFIFLRVALKFTKNDSNGRDDTRGHRHSLPLLRLQNWSAGDSIKYFDPRDFLFFKKIFFFFWSYGFLIGTIQSTNWAKNVSKKKVIKIGSTGKQKEKRLTYLILYRDYRYVWKMF